MNPALIVSILSEVPSLIQAFQTLKTSGQITPEDQAKVQAALVSLRVQDFTGPEWKVVS